MPEPLDRSRRAFLRRAAGGVAVVLMPFPGLRLAAAEPEAGGPAPGPGWSGPPGKARYRIDGVPKVTGAKLYARDFRARDLPGWPEREAHALVLRVVHADRLYCGVDLKSLPPELQPFRVVTADDLTRDHVADLWTDEPGALLVPSGQRPTLLGQPAAILLFDSAGKLREAARRLQFRPEVLCYGATAAVPAPQPLADAIHLTRFGGEFSQAQDGPSDPGGSTPVDQQAQRYRRKIQDVLDAPELKKFAGTFETQVVDPLFMEPESGLGWYDAAAQSLHLLLGTQSPNGDVAAAGSQAGALFHESRFTVKTVQLHPCYPGGGFGGRDTSPFLSLLALSAVYAERPVRLAFDRYEQFQAGIKRNASTVALRAAVDARGRVQALQADVKLHGGGKQNYSPFVADLAGYTAGNAYEFPNAAVDSVALSSVGVTAGSMRGFGGPQAIFASESLMDEIAAGLGLDPIGFRRQNVLREGGRTVTGAPLDEAPRLVEICERAEKSRVWTEREQERRARAAGGKLYGVGFALAMQAYGTNIDGVMAGVEVDERGRLGVLTNCVDMGNGSATTLAISTAGALGANAERVTMGEVELFERALPLQSGGEDEWDNPLWTASWSMSSSACLTAFQQVHVVEQAARVLFRTGLWPAARRLWGLPPSGGPSPDECRWEDGRLVAPGLPPLALTDLARRAHADGDVVAALVHAVYQSQWIEAEYRVGGLRARWPIDALATRRAVRGPEAPGLLRRRRSPLGPARAGRRPAGGAFEFHPRRDTRAPAPQTAWYGRTLYAPSGALAAVEVDPSTGAVQVAAVETFLDAGRVLQPELLSGQYEGAVAMGIGYALLEELPLEAGGAGDGTWNLDRYHPPLAGDVPLGRVRLETLPPLGGDPKGKGIAEAVLCPIAPAIANAVAAATGKRFRALPITPARVREALGHG